MCHLIRYIFLGVFSEDNTLKVNVLKTFSPILLKYSDINSNVNHLHIIIYFNSLSSRAVPGSATRVRRATAAPRGPPDPPGPRGPRRSCWSGPPALWWSGWPAPRGPRAPRGPPEPRDLPGPTENRWGHDPVYSVIMFSLYIWILSWKSLRIKASAINHIWLHHIYLIITWPGWKLDSD